MTKQEFIQRVLLIMNEAGMFDQAGSAYIGADSAQIDKHIEGSYVDAWRRIAKVAPRTWLANKSIYIKGLIDGIGIDNNGTGYAINELIYVTKPTGGHSATLKITTVSNTGEVTGLSIVDTGSGYTSESSVTFTSNTTAGQDLTLTVSSVKDTISIESSQGIGYVILPDDFYLLTKFKMEGWKVAVMEASVANTRVANIQSNEYTRGSQLRPVTVIDSKDIDGVIKPVLQYYSLPKGLATHTVEEALYVPVVQELSKLELTTDLGINDQIIVPLTYISAATVFTIFEKYPVAQALEARAEAMMPGLISLKGTSATVKQ